MVNVKSIATTAAVSAIALATSAKGEWFDGEVTLFENPFFSSGTGGGSITVAVTGGVCYDVGCFNDRASSVSWRNLPELYMLGPSNLPVYIAFYTDTQCRGDRRSWSTGNYPPNNLAVDGIDNQITSFQVGLLGTSFKQTRLACPYRVLTEAVSNATVNATQSQ